MMLDIVEIKYDIILNILWLKVYNLVISWKQWIISFFNCVYKIITTTILFIKIIWMKSDNKCLIEIIEKSLKYLFKYNEFECLFIKDKSASVLSEY